jgi:uridine kinase
LTFEQREQHNFDHPDALETSLLVEHIAALKRKEDVVIPTYDYKTHSRLSTNHVLPSRPIILVEGILIFNDPELYKEIDIKVFVDTDDDIRLIRRIRRDMTERERTLESVLHQYVTTVRPMHLQFVEPSKRNADIIVPVGLNSVALDLVVSRLKNFIASSVNKK